MKKLFLLGVTVLFCACTINDTHTVAINILADRTDPIIPNPKIQDVTSLLNIDTQPNIGAAKQYRKICTRRFRKPTRYGMAVSSITVKKIMKTHSRSP